MSRANRERRQRNRHEVARANGNGMAPRFTEKAPLELREIPVPEQVQRTMVNEDNSYVRAYLLGECSVIVTREHGRWHISIAHPRRDPTWDEVAAARYRLMPDEILAAMLLPPRERYVNLHPHAFQVMQVEDSMLSQTI